jgi:para-aminobenzoate synthetase/4-amino-4-deoxychorismate lyase
VSVRDAFRLERWPTVWQMTSTVHAETAAPLSAILVALFPCASITGAPKIQTMRLIAELESTPRGLYTGALGFALPERRAQFNVAIRTAVIDREAGSLSYGVGGGIVWDSQPKEEWAEALIKARALRRRPRVFDLLETLAWFPERGYWLLDRHLNRLSRSALYFGRPFDEVAVGEVLGAAATWDEAQRVRLLLDAEGRATVESAPLPPPPERPWRVAPAAARVDPRDPLLYHKTTLRTRYDRARRARPDVDDVLLVNRRGEVTESAVANVVFLRDGRLCTPPLACGLLPGVYRELLLERGWVREAVLHAEDLPLVEDLWLVNSVRGWIRAELRRG